MPLNLRALLICALTAMGGMAPRTVLALPSFATQTGFACAACHTTAFGPQLTPVGQEFKLNGYLLDTGNADAIPLAAMLLTTFSRTKADQPGGAAPSYKTNDNNAVDQTSVFYAGKIAGNTGAFIQATYDGIAHQYHWDNLDVRYADQGMIGSAKTVYGVSLNNNPTVQDLWNSTPAWAYPFASSVLAPAPAAAPVIQGALAQKVYGLSGYMMLDDLVYLELGGYRMLPNALQTRLGVAAPGANTLQGISPYWRAAVQKQSGSHYASLGLFGLSARMLPGGDGSAGENRYTDLGYDATWQFSNNTAHSFNANLTYIHEIQQLRASVAQGNASAASNQINTLRLNAGYVYRQTWSLSGGPFWINGGADNVAFAPNPISGSANGNPDSRGYVAQLEFVPFGKTGSLWRPFLNVRLGLQYVGYTEFNGGSRN
ncbi:MAG: cytochrome C, partial [Stenotrophobium sp.]